MRILISLFISMFMLSCGNKYISQEERVSGYTYIPMEALSVKGLPDNSSPADVLALMHDNTIRVSVQEINSDGQLAYGPIGVTSKTSRYKITFDHVISDSQTFDIWIAKTAISWDTGIREAVSVKARLISSTHLIGSEQYHFRHTAPGKELCDDLKINQQWGRWNLRGWRKFPDAEKIEAANTDPKKMRYLNFERVSIPVYLGLGLRAEAELQDLSGELKISGLGSLSATEVSGNLITRTLGVNGSSVQAALPSDSELNRTSIQNSIISIAKIKTLLYTDADIQLNPRVVGMYLPLPADLKLINGLISEMAGTDITWDESKEEVLFKIKNSSK